MRKLTSSLALLMLALLPLGTARAQYAVPPSRLSFPSPTPTAPAETPAPEDRSSSSPTPTPTASANNRPSRPRDGVLDQKPVRAVALPKHRRAPSPSPTPARKPLFRRAPARPATGARASRPTFDFSESNWATAATIRSLERKWEAAIKSNDTGAMEKLLADNFAATSSGGRSASRSRFLREIKRDKNVYRSAKVRGMNVRNRGPDVAVVAGIATESGVTPDGRRFTTTRQFTDTWRQQKGKWQLIASKVVKVPK